MFLDGMLSVSPNLHFHPNADAGREALHTFHGDVDMNKSCAGRKRLNVTAQGSSASGPVQDGNVQLSALDHKCQMSRGNFQAWLQQTGAAVHSSAHVGRNSTAMHTARATRNTDKLTAGDVSLSNVTESFLY